MTTDDKVAAWTGVEYVLECVDHARNIRAQAAAACFTHTHTQPQLL